MMAKNRVQIIDLYNGRSQTISWDEIIDDKVFEDIMEKQIRRCFDVHPDTWVELVALSDSRLIQISKQYFTNIQEPICLKITSKMNFGPLKTYDVSHVDFKEKMYGMTVREEKDNVVVGQFTCRADGSPATAEASGCVHIGDVLYKIQGSYVIGRSYESIVKLLQTPKRPLHISFFHPLPNIAYKDQYAIVFSQQYLDLTISPDEENVVITRLPCRRPGVAGYAESYGARVNDTIHAVAGTIIKGPDYDTAVHLLKESRRPMVVIFSRAKNNQPEEKQHYEPLAVTIHPPMAKSLSLGPESQRISNSESLISNESEIRDDTVMSSHSSNLETYGQEEMEELLITLEKFERQGIINGPEFHILKKSLDERRPDVMRALKDNNDKAITGIVRSPCIQRWNHILLPDEYPILAGPVLLKKKKYHLVLTNHRRVLCINSNNKIELDIPCEHIIFASRGKENFEFVIRTVKKTFCFIEKMIGPRIWAYAITPYLFTQGSLNVLESSSTDKTKERYFVLQSDVLIGYKNKNLAHETGAPKKTLSLTHASYRILSISKFKFELLSPELDRKGKRLILIANSKRDFKRWTASLHAVLNLSDQRGRINTTLSA